MKLAKKQNPINHVEIETVQPKVFRISVNGKNYLWGKRTASQSVVLYCEQNSPHRYQVGAAQTLPEAIAVAISDHSGIPQP